MLTHISLAKKIITFDHSGVVPARPVVPAAIPTSSLPCFLDALPDTLSAVGSVESIASGDPVVKNTVPPEPPSSFPASQDKPLDSTLDAPSDLSDPLESLGTGTPSNLPSIPDVLKPPSPPPIEDEDAFIPGKKCRRIQIGSSD